MSDIPIAPENSLQEKLFDAGYRITRTDEGIVKAQPPNPRENEFIYVGKNIDDAWDMCRNYYNATLRAPVQIPTDDAIHGIQMIVCQPDGNELVEDVTFPLLQTLIEAAKKRGDYIEIHPKGELNSEYPVILFANKWDEMND